MMDLDEELIEKIKSPLIGKLGLKPSKYFSALEDEGVVVADESHIADEKFLNHFMYAIQEGLIENKENTTDLADFGVVLGADHFISLCDSGFIKIGTARPGIVEPSSNITQNTFNFAGEFSGNLQSGNSNSINQSEHSVSASKGGIVSWILNNIVGVVVAGLILASIVSWLGLSGP